MKIITCAGYYRSGSSAITDYLSEFEGVKSLGTFEFRFLQDPDGISALETNIIEHPHRHNTSHAIKRFIKYSKFENGNIFSKRYRKYFGKSYWELTKQYIQDIVKVQCDCIWRYDKIERGWLLYSLNKVFEVISERLNKGKRITPLSLFHEQGYFTDISREDFYKATKKYTSELFASTGINSEYLIVDQLAAPTDAQRYMNYVDNLYVIIVDRDPRDLFILENEAKWGVIPYKNVEDFCKWYRITRKHRLTDKYDPNRVLFVRLEDLIYEYDTTTEIVRKFVGLDKDKHIRSKEELIPAKSKKGTNLVNVYPRYKKQVEYIENHLPEYLYDYSNYEINTERPEIFNK